MTIERPMLPRCRPHARPDGSRGRSRKTIPRDLRRRECRSGSLMTDDSETIEPVCGGARSLSAASHGNTQQKRNQQRTKRRFARYIA